MSHGIFVASIFLFIIFFILKVFKMVFNYNFRYNLWDVFESNWNVRPVR